MSKKGTSHKTCSGAEQLRHPEIFALGDVAGVPKGKTAASVKFQVPVVEDHLASAIEGRDGIGVYNRYTGIVRLLTLLRFTHSACA